MPHEVYITSKKAREILQVTNKTLRRWDSANKIRTIRTPSNIRRYNLQDIHNIMDGRSNSNSKKKICYCRVSSKKQMDDLERQKDFFKTQFPNHELVTDIGSGINWKRKGLKTILEQAMQRNLGEVVVAHRDRLCRFAFELLEWVFSSNGVKLVVLDQSTAKSSDAKLADDILSIIQVYSCRKMGRRRYTIKKNKNLSNQTTKTVITTVDGNTKVCIQQSASGSETG